MQQCCQVCSYISSLSSFTTCSYTILFLATPSSCLCMFDCHHMFVHQCSCSFDCPTGCHCLINGKWMQIMLLFLTWHRLIPQTNLSDPLALHLWKWIGTNVHSMFIGSKVDWLLASVDAINGHQLDWIHFQVVVWTGLLFKTSWQFFKWLCVKVYMKSILFIILKYVILERHWKCSICPLHSNHLPCSHTTF